MATADDRRPRRGPMEIEKFGELVLSHLRATQTGRSRTPHCYAVRVVGFLTRHPSVKTAADITPDVIDEFTETCGDLTEGTRRDVLYKFRLICKYAVDWGYLGRNPFDDRPPMKSPANDRAVSRGRKLDIEQVDLILKYTDSSMDDWRWDRLHAIAATFAYAGLMTGEALDLKVEDCDLGQGTIWVRRRAEKLRSKDDPVVHIPPALVERLKAWLPRRLEGRRAKYLGACFGTILADDGRTEVTDEAQRRAVADMIRWRGQGWGTLRIANELTRLGIPTKTGNPRWHMATVQNILKREGKYYVDDPAAGGDGPGRAAGKTKADPGWMFPSITGGHWSLAGDRGYSVTEQLGAVGKALGIEGLTSESMRRFYLENRRYILSLWGEKAPAGPTMPPPSPAGPIPATPGPATNRDVSIDQEAIPCPLNLRDFGSLPMVGGDEISVDLTRAEYAILTVLVNGWGSSHGFTYENLDDRAQVVAPRKVIERMCSKPGYGPIVAMIEKSGGRPQLIRLISPHPAS